MDRKVETDKVTGRGHSDRDEHRERERERGRERERMFIELGHLPLSNGKWGMKVVQGYTKPTSIHIHINTNQTPHHPPTHPQLETCTHRDGERERDLGRRS